MSGLKLGEILVTQGYIKPEVLNDAIKENGRTGVPISMVLLTQGKVREPQMREALEKHYQVPSIDLNAFTFDPSLQPLIPRDFCEKHVLVPVQKMGQTLVVAFSDPSNLYVKEDLRFITKCKIQPVVAPESSILGSLEKIYGGVNLKNSDVARTEDEDSDGEEALKNSELMNDDDSDEQPVIKFVNSVLVEAIKRKASDIHFESYEKKFRVRYRIDGILIEATHPPYKVAPAIISRIKIMAKLDIAEKRRPQDGRIKITTARGQEMAFRVSIIPTIWGEKVVMRLLDKSNLQLDMTKLGFEPDDLKIFKHAINLPQGMVLITGPTGSGKTTTIYSALAELNKLDTNICTAEDPVEFNLDGINQVQMHSDIELDFAAALRSFLRQDPDIVMVGEIRDLETAEVSFKAASTGHLVLSTLHTNDAPQTVVRLIEMGIAGYVIGSSLSLVVAQRLVGKICDSCKIPIEVTPEVLINLGVDPKEVAEYKIFKGKGCNICNNTGVKGRLAIYEVMPMIEPIKDLVLKGGSAAEIRRVCRTHGMRTLRRSALLKLKRGETTIEEVVNSSIKDM
jgi:type IV pilus assembly protein PilB